MFIVQVAAVSCAATQVPEIKLANQSLRKTGFCNAFQVELFFIEVFLASVHKSLRLCDLCKELAFGAAAQKGEVAIFIQLVRAQPVVPPVPGESQPAKERVISAKSR